MNAWAGADGHWRALVTCVSDAYRAVDSHAARFASSKLKRDPVFRHVFEHGLIPPGATVLDLGCGQGLLAGCVAAAADAQRRGDWPAAWGPAPTDTRMIGLDLSPLQLRRAAVSGLAAARFVLADMRHVDFPPCDVVACIDTLHYLPLSEQDDVLLRARNALRAGGVLLLRVNDASAPVRWRLGLWIDRITRAVQGGGFEPVHGRTLESWRAVLRSAGLRGGVPSDERAPAVREPAAGGPTPRRSRTHDRSRRRATRRWHRPDFRRCFSFKTGEPPRAPATVKVPGAETGRPVS